MTYPPADSAPAASRRGALPRRRWPRWLAAAWLLLAAVTAQAAGPIVLEVFVREGCPHCADAKRFLADFRPTRPDLKIVYRDIDADDANMEALIEVARAAGRASPAVPTFVVDGRVLVGFATAEISGPAVAALVDGAREPPLPAGPLDAERLGLPVFSVATGLLAGLNPCAMWTLLFLLSMLVHLHDRTRIAVLSASFVGASIVLHFAMLAAWLNVFAIAGASRALSPLAGTVGIVMGVLNVKDFVAPGRGPSLSIPASVKPALGERIRDILATRTLGAAIAAVVALALLVNVSELLCTAGLAAIYSATLARFELEPLAGYAQLGLYMVGYALPPTGLAVGAVSLLSSPHLSAAAGRWLKLLSGLSMIGLAGWMLLSRW